MGSEYLLHVVAECDSVKEIWDGIGISWDSNLNLETFWHWFIHLVQHKEERIWEKSSIAKILSMVEELKVLNEKLPVIKVVGSDCWRPPQDLWVKLNFDAAYKIQTNKSCSGFIIRNGRGKVMGSGVTHHGNISDAFMAEAVACFQGLLFAKETGFTTVEVEGDSRTVIEKINQEGFGRADLDSIILDIKSMGRFFHQLRFRHVRRDANRVAQFIAREGNSRSENSFWMEDFPSAVRDMVIAEETRDVSQTDD
ncbi:hypothetical protein Gotur_016688 [Gossypium turneri]